MGRGDGESGARSLKTAAVVLRALRYLGSHPAGMTSAELGTHLGKSPATARYVINTLCEAGYAERDAGGTCRLRPAPPWGSWTPEPGPTVAFPGEPDLGDPEPRAVLSEAVTELYRRTRQRTYLVRRSASVVATVIDARGHQGLARLPGLAEHVPPGRAHALALTKVLLAISPAWLDAVEREPLAALTDRTITTVDALRRDLADVRERGFAVDQEEYAEGFCGIAAPISAPSGTATLALGLSTSARRFALEGPELVDTVMRVADEARHQWAASRGLAVSVPTSDRSEDPDHVMVSGPRR